ncbi:hypothetical protein [Micromonospora thermarum]|uniref:Uncharacterized protein n=1 Tax=Micromonospora thermarum TaxID=2720024 RepID=A0ABX0Z8E8_9ACTN|nr:hypothetical protein [Micromonospora thermarum]NJP32318.1 hypothetical protein [Micromonospora thermarum]
MITNNERMRIRRQMQRRIQDVVAERRRARLMEPTATELAGDPAESTAGGSALTRTA